MFGNLFYNLSNNILATPLRIIIGLVFINQGYQNLRAEEIQEFQNLMFNMSSYKMGDLLTNTFSVVLIIAGVAVLLGIFVRIIGALMAFFIITNLLAGFGSDQIFSDFNSTVTLFQDRLILAISSLTLFFLGGGFFCFDGLIFRRSRSATSSRDENSSDDDNVFPVS